MKNARIITCLILIGILSTSCFKIAMVAPHGMNVTLISPEDPVTVKRRWRTWFVVWGLTSLTDKMPIEYIQRENLTEVRLITEDNVPDAFHGMLYNLLIPIGLVPQSLVLEGNRENLDTL